MRVACNAPYPVPLDSGRHLRPGETAEIEESVHHGWLLESGALGRVSEPEAPSVPPPSPKRPSVAPGGLSDDPTTGGAER